MCIILILVERSANSFKCCRLTAKYIGYPLKIGSNFLYIMGLVCIFYYFVSFGTWDASMKICLNDKKKLVATNKMRNKYIFLSAQMYRKVEIMIAYSHMASIVLFIFICKCILWLKKNCAKDEDYLNKDPFMYLITKSGNDFLNSF